MDSLPVHPSCFYFAVKEGSVNQVVEILKTNPAVDVNWVNTSDEGRTVLHWACQRDDTFLTALLLAHPRIEVNPKHANGGTPLSFACGRGKTSFVRLLLKDLRVNINDIVDGSVALEFAAYHEHLDILKWFIASGRALDLGESVVSAERSGLTDTLHLLRKFETNPDQVREEIRLELDYFEEVAAEVFALVVFVSDGLLEVRQADEANPALGFFLLALRLPLELQMLLCRRVVGLSEENILTQEREAAFKSLAIKYWFG